ncbi:unnamed protein product [Diatraea saccharalis]|uniref:Uncharacterized protein n=1 Tax=Diatraea saccharalis TaxID=40085 RepID=A0A9N9QUZ0_9NEOP|nr:unnamed protein product [Diatraea saccharalis]
MLHARHRGPTEEDHDPCVPAHTEPGGGWLRVQYVHVSGPRSLVQRTMLKGSTSPYTRDAEMNFASDHLRQNRMVFNGVFVSDGCSVAVLASMRGRVPDTNVPSPAVERRVVGHTFAQSRASTRQTLANEEVCSRIPDSWPQTSFSSRCKIIR